MSVFVVANYTVHDPDRYLEYVKAVRDTVQLYGGNTLAADHEPSILEGEPSSVIVIVAFESKEKARQWYQSEGYQKIIHFRKESCRGWVALCNGFSGMGG